jgi:Domain of unknown function DUF29
MTKYEADLHAWTREQAELLRKRAGNEIDWDNLAEEIESLGSSQRGEIRSRLTVLLIHLLKWRYQSDHQSNSWRASIHEARYRIELILEDSPSLKAYPGEALAGSYRSALNDMTINYLDTQDMPQTCPWTIEQVLSDDFLP